MMMMMMVTLFEEIFLSTSMFGYIGPVALVIIGYLLAMRDKYMGAFWFIIIVLFAAHYFMLVDATPDYWWHIIILLFGGLITCVYPLLTPRWR